jgi:hypothetical protein
VLLGCLLWGLVGAWRRDRREGGDWSLPAPGLRPTNLVAVVIVALTALNGLSPYLGLKSATGFNMFANQVTADGATNHFIVTRTAGLRAEEGATLEIVETDDDQLARFQDLQFGVPASVLGDYLAQSPSSAVTVRWPDGEIEVIDARPADRSGQGSDRTGRLVIDETAWWKYRFLNYLSVPTGPSTPCENPRLVAP